MNQFNHEKINKKFRGHYRKAGSIYERSSGNRLYQSSGILSLTGQTTQEDSNFFIIQSPEVPLSVNAGRENQRAS
jgi:hypothetical protein